MFQLWKPALLAAALIVPATLAPTVLRADDHDRDSHHYQDKKHHDEHEWNNHEDQAYRMWAKEKHRKYTDFQRLKERDRNDYWNWRHNHSDSVLKIDIR